MLGLEGEKIKSIKSVSLGKQPKFEKQTEAGCFGIIGCLALVCRGTYAPRMLRQLPAGHTQSTGEPQPPLGSGWKVEGTVVLEDLGRGAGTAVA